ncbi:MAG: helix-turn-helix domain-containing protein [Treponema sp.]|jgi:transcriptional regulator with XRE-family HTH domain|nr:helix-turn-helix domain-containing protein [Treponema sp.]
MIDNITDRLIALRKSMDLNQGQFSERLGLTSAAISSLELGKSQLTEQNIRLICLTFNVNEAWLRTGEGAMFNEYSPHEQDLLEKFRKISPEMQKHILEYVNLLIKGQSEMIAKPPAKTK